MMIKYAGTNVHALPNITHKAVTLKNKKTGKKRTVMKIDTTQSPQDIQWLRPGWNEFPRAIWEQNMKNPSILHMVESGLIQLMSEKVEVKVGKKKLTKIVGQDDEEIALTFFTEPRAIAIVKDMYNRDILQRWLDEELRHKVKRALIKQLEPLLNKPEKEDD